MSRGFAAPEAKSPLRTVRRGLMLMAVALALISCGGSTTGATDAASAAPSTSAPSPSAPATASDAPSANPSLVGGGDLAEAVVAALQSEPLVTHVDQVGTVEQGATDLVAKMTGDISGSDISLTLTLELGSQRSVSELVAVGDDLLIRLDGGEWQVGDLVAARASIEALIRAARLLDDPAALAHVGTATVDGRELQHLVAVGDIPYVPSSGGSGSYTAFDLYVEVDGTPVLLEGSFTATDANGATVSGDTRIAYSDFGGPIDIELPASPS